MPRKAPEPNADENIASETSDLGEDEYEVEKIVKHRASKNGKGYDYMLKWIGYPDSQNTWEHEKNLGCEDLIKEYWDGLKSSQSGRKKRAKEVEPNDKHITTPNHSKTETPIKKRKSTKSPENKLKKSDGKPKPIEISEENEEVEELVDMESESEIQVDEDYVPPEGIDWEDEVVMVESVEQRDGLLQAIVRWKNGIYTEHLTRYLRDKCPKKLVQFYEARLKFTVKEEV